MGVEMKFQTILLLGFVAHLTQPNCQVCIEPKWNNLENNCQKEKQFGCKLMLVGSITFRKQCKDCIKLDKLILTWHGAEIEKLCGSLYKKLPEKEFKPLQENVICDALWNKATQSLILDFDVTQTLSAVNIFYVVLTIPDGMEEPLKSGHFSLKKTGLPELVEFKEQKLDLALAPTPE